MLYESPIGLINIRSSNAEISEINFVSDEKRATFSIQNEATVEEVECSKQLGEYFSGTRQVFDLPIMQTGTAFQQKVWNELLNISYGRTISYMELSKKINNVKAIRAVGTANGSNHIPIVVPCHRVIGANGNLTGYSGGLKIKQWLLEHENKYKNGANLLF